MVRATAVAAAAAALLLAGCADEQPTPAAAPSPSASPTPVQATTAVLPAPVPLESRVERRTPVDYPDWLAAGAGYLWVFKADGHVVRVDPATDEATTFRTHDVEAAGCQGLGADDDGVWVCVAGGAVVRLDPATGQAVATVDVDKVNEQGTIPVQDGRVWLLTDGGSTLTGVDATTTEVVTEVDLGAVCNDLAGAPGAVWVACFQDGQVLRVDVAGEVTDRVRGLPGVRQLSVGSHVWAGYADGLARIDLDTRAVTGALDVLAGTNGSDLGATDDGVWVRVPRTFLQRVDAETMQVTEVLTAPEQTGGCVLEAFGSVWATAQDDAVLYRVRPSG